MHSPTRYDVIQCICMLVQSASNPDNEQASRIQFIRFNYLCRKDVCDFQLRCEMIILSKKIHTSFKILKHSSCWACLKIAHAKFIRCSSDLFVRLWITYQVLLTNLFNFCCWMANWWRNYVALLVRAKSFLIPWYLIDSSYRTPPSILMSCPHLLSTSFTFTAMLRPAQASC